MLRPANATPVRVCMPSTISLGSEAELRRAASNRAVAVGSSLNDVRRDPTVAGYSQGLGGRGNQISGGGVQVAVLAIDPPNRLASQARRAASSSAANNPSVL